MPVRQTKDVGDWYWPHAFPYCEQKFGRTGKLGFIDLFWMKYVIMKHYARVSFFISLEMELLCRAVMPLWMPYSSYAHIYHAERQHSWALCLSFRTWQWRLMKTAGLCHLPLSVIFHSAAAHSKSASEAYPQVLGSATQGLVPSCAKKVWGIFPPLHPLFLVTWRVQYAHEKQAFQIYNLGDHTRS